MEYLKLLDVSKPIRYINQEFNSYHKHDKDLFKICLIFPDVYEVGMSHLGIKILYEKLNNHKELFCERFFMPWVDALENFKKDIFTSLESGIPLKEFNILGFSLQYELSYTNILRIIKESEIPLLSNERSSNDPTIIAGGPCALNPHPISHFIDAFFMGEMEEELADILIALKQSNLSRQEKLEKLNSYPFIYVPSLQKDKVVSRNIYKNFHKDVTLKKPLVPLMPVVQDRVTIEISRGCTRGCRFCQAGMIYRPSRERDISDILNNALEQIKNTGYLEVSLLSLSAADYSCLEDLLIKLASKLTDDKISLSLPSIRADRVKDFIFRELKKIRKSGFTIAPESGSQRMRNIINKDLSEDEIIDAVICAANNGFNGVKLYFMIGLPFEEDEDVLAIADLAIKIKKSVRKSFNVTVSVSNFVPKPFTPFQWFPQNSPDELIRKQSLIIEKLKTTKIKYKFHDPYQSILEGAISRGDERLNNVFMRALENGNIYDGWSEFFNFQDWEINFQEAGVTFEDTAMKEYTQESKLPWDNIDIGVSKTFLWEEYTKSKFEKITEDCREFNCTNCGVCNFKDIKNIDANNKISENKQPISLDSSFEKIGFIFSKKNISSLFSAIDLNRIISHSFNIAGIELAYSNGFNPQPKISYLYPLPVGVEGENEILLTKINTNNLDNKLKKLNEILPKGLYIKKYFDSSKFNLAGELIGEYSFDKNSFIIIKKHLDEDTAFYEKKGKKGNIKKVDLKNYMLKLTDKSIQVKISNLGTFNFIEFFKFLNYNISKIVVLRNNILPINGDK